MSVLARLSHVGGSLTVARPDVMRVRGVATTAVFLVPRTGMLVKPHTLI